MKIQIIKRAVLFRVRQTKSVMRCDTSIFQPKFNDDGTFNPNFYDPYDEHEKGE